MKDSESAVVPVKLTELSGVHGDIANSLLSELKEALRAQKYELYYQGQYDNKGICVGAEALLRLNQKQFGFLYPPLIIKLAEEGGFLAELEKQILTRAMKDADEIHAATANTIEIGVNVLPSTLADPSYMAILDSYARKHGKEGASHICLEITEQTALILSARTEELFDKIHGLGYKLAIDDFSMGHTSLSYLKNNHFDMVKLDGELVKESSANPRCREIIASIVQLSHTLGFTVLAEFVETTAERTMLGSLGCSEYQGWLYAKAVPESDFIRKLVLP